MQYGGKHSVTAARAACQHQQSHWTSNDSSCTLAELLVNKAWMSTNCIVLSHYGDSSTETYILNRVHQLLDIKYLTAIIQGRLDFAGIQ